MKAIVIERFGGPETLVIKEVPPPEPEVGWVSVKVFAFGLNHAETHMRKGEWAEWMPVSGVECVGVVSACPGKEFELDTPVAALMGGLGRTISGSYAEYTRVRATNVVALGPAAAKLSWAQLAAIPVSYATAWTFIFRNLEITSGQTLLIRGATSALGIASLNLAVHAGAKVTATTRNAERSEGLKTHGAISVELEKPGLAKRLIDEGHEKFDAVLDLIGNSALLDSLTIVRRGGRLCLGGWLGGLDPIVEFNPLLQMASGVHFSLFASPIFGEPGFPVNDVPLAEVIQMVAENRFDANPSRVFKFNEIQEAHRVMEAGKANGKLVVVVVE